MYNTMFLLLLYILHNMLTSQILFCHQTVGLLYAFYPLPCVFPSGNHYFVLCISVNYVNLINCFKENPLDFFHFSLWFSIFCSTDCHAYILLSYWLLYHWNYLFVFSQKFKSDLSDEYRHSSFLLISSCMVYLFPSPYL